MRKSLADLINKTIVFQYELPNAPKDIKRSIYSTDNDACYLNANDDDLSGVIYNSIVEYAFNEHDLKDADYQNLHAQALQTRIRYDASKGIDDQIKYGFFGEVLLYCILYIKYGSSPLISKGYFYSPTAKSESTGFDSYHIIQHQDVLELWFGEVKFHASHEGGIASAFKSLDVALSDEYLETNIKVLPTRMNDLNIKGTKIEAVIQEWQKNPSIKIIDEIKKHQMKLVYPILLLFDGNKSGYDESIKSVIAHIEKRYKPKTFSLSIPVSIFLILVPVGDTKTVKTQVLEWIKTKKPLI